MNIFLLLGTVVTSAFASAISVLQPPIEATELRSLVIETVVEEHLALSPTPFLTDEPEPLQRIESAVTAELAPSTETAPADTKIETAQLVSVVTPTAILPLSTTTPSPSLRRLRETWLAVPTVTPTITQTAPTATATPSPTTTPAITIASTASLISGTPVPPPPKSLNSDTILSLINAHRATKNLPALEKEDRLCALAQSRGPELYNEIFVTKNVHAGFYSRKLPYWITENMAHYGSEEAIVKWWLGSTIHRRAIEGNATYSCGACYGNSCAQLFTKYTPK